MKKLLIVGAAFVLVAPVGAFAAAACCEDMKQGGAHAGHDAPANVSE